MANNKLDVAILGATGAVGQRFIQLLENHPWFQVAEVVGSERSAGKTYGEAAHWVLDGTPPKSVVNLTVKGLEDPLNSPLVFSALPSDAATVREVALATAGHVICTNASPNRMVEDVPLLLPEVNADHIALIDVQRQNRGWTSGAIIANSNCTVMPLVMSLVPLKNHGIRKIFSVSAQATSGAGYPGVASLDILDNIVPYVSGDEQKMEVESLKMLGEFANGGIQWLDAKVSATCNRVPVTDGHIINLSIELETPASVEEIIDIWKNYQAPEIVRTLPSAPAYPLQYLPHIDRPQPRRDRNAGNGMVTSLGRLRPCPLLTYRYAALSHNTIRGAAGGSILNAELLAAQGYLTGFNPTA